MNKLLLAISILFLGLFSSCDKCKDVSCENGGKCDKGECECTDFYSGSECKDETRAKYYGKYAGPFTYSDGSVEQDTVELVAFGTDVTKIDFVDGEGIKITLTNSTNFALSGEEVDGNEKYTISGSGKFTSTAMSFTGTTVYTVNGAVMDTETIRFDGTKF